MDFARAFLPIRVSAIISTAIRVDVAEDEKIEEKYMRSHFLQSALIARQWKAYGEVAPSRAVIYCLQKRIER